MNNDNLFEIEWKKTIQTLADKNASFKELEYFLNLGREYSQLYNNKNIKVDIPKTSLKKVKIKFGGKISGSFRNNQIISRVFNFRL